MTKSWTEGTELSIPNTGVASSWIYSDFPTRWNTPGGDFVEEPLLGDQILDTQTSNLAKFALNATLLQILIDDPSRNHGFMIQNDDDPSGFWDFESRECEGRSDDTCFGGDTTCCRFGIPPQLKIEIAGNPTISPTTSPTKFPSLSPTKTPSQSPTISPSDAATNSPTLSTTVPTNRPIITQVSFAPSLRTGTNDTNPPSQSPSSMDRESSICATFSQTLRLPMLTLQDQALFRNTFVTYINQLTLEYTSDSDIVTDTVLLRLEQVPERSSLLYTICWAADIDSISSTYPDDFLSYMAITANRRKLESHLQDEGIAVVPESLSQATLSSANEIFATPSSSSPRDALVVGVSVAASVVGLLLVLWIAQRYRRRKQSSNDDSRDGVPSLPVLEALPLEYPNNGDGGGMNHRNAGPLLVNNNDRRPPADLNYKQQGQSFDEGNSDYHVDYKDQGRSVFGE